MRNKYITAIIIAALASSSNVIAQNAIPKLVVSIAIDELRSDLLETFRPLYTNGGFKKLLDEGLLYTDAQYSFYPVDKESALADINTGTTPFYNGIVAGQWFDRNSLRPIKCVEDSQYGGIFTSESVSPRSLKTTTLSDEIKVQSKGKALVYSIAKDSESAVIPAGYNADGAYWINRQTGAWCTSTYYPKKSIKWLESYNLYDSPGKKSTNSRITDMALKCILENSLGKDDTTDMLLLTYSLANDDAYNKKDDNVQDRYLQIDKDFTRLLTDLNSKIGLQNILFIVTGAGHDNEKPQQDHDKSPYGTLYINRTANLLNMYLGALYGSDSYIEGYYRNHIYLNAKTIERKRINFSEIVNQSKHVLRQSAGVANAFATEELMSGQSSIQQKLANGISLQRSGDIILETAPGWNIINEETHQKYEPLNLYVPTPILFFGYGIKGDRVSTTVPTERIPATIAKAVRIRAPSGCKEPPLF